MMQNPPHIFYLVHDLSDTAVARRIRILLAGGAAVTVAVAGFRRTEAPVADVEGCPAIDLGRTYNGGFIQRIASVLRETALIQRHKKNFEKADIIIARNLEMLAVAVRGRSLCAKPPVLVYESLDIHRLLLNQGAVGRMMRWLEGWLSRRASALITSSPAFVKSYFEPLSQIRLPVIMAENKVYDPAFAATADLNLPRAPGPVWRIGWYGIIRCRKSFDMLTRLVRDSGGTIAVVIRGRPALDQIPDFHAVVNATPGLFYDGPYKNPDDLHALYRDVHFTWAIDMFEEGQNSSWLLPNRLYEGGLYNTVPLARATVETGRFLVERGIGVTLADPLPESLGLFFRDLDAISYQRLEKAAMEIPHSQWLLRDEDSLALIGALKALQPARI
ncbi:MAG: exoL [Micavibrio sp.]|nr:exoL [Micavibrio sp.]